MKALLPGPVHIVPVLTNTQCLRRAVHGNGTQADGAEGHSLSASGPAQKREEPRAAKGSEDHLGPTGTSQSKIRVMAGRNKLGKEELLVGEQPAVCHNSVLAKMEWARE